MVSKAGESGEIRIGRFQVAQGKHVLGELIVRDPSECTEAEIRAFVKLASAGGEVKPADIERGVKQAKFLLWIECDGVARAVASLKNPFDGYREGVFEKSTSPLRAKDYPLEFGYAYTDEHYRRRGYGRALTRKALEIIKGQGVYATVRADNEGMQSLLKELGFTRSGTDYASTNRNVLLTLLVLQSEFASGGQK